MKIIISETQKPPPDSAYGDTWERGLDPWHVDAFPPGLEKAALDYGEKRKGGWYLCDMWGNQVEFIVDGIELEV